MIDTNIPKHYFHLVVFLLCNGYFYLNIFLCKKELIIQFFLLFQTKDQAIWGSKVEIQLLGTKTHHGAVSEKSATIFWPLCGQFHFWGQASRQTDRTSFKIHNVAVRNLISHHSQKAHRCEMFVVFSPVVPSKWKKNILVLLSQFCSICIFFEESVFTFRFLNDKIHNYVKKKHNCEFYHSKIEK